MKLFAHEQHHNDNPWSEAPHWTVELGAMMVLLIANQEKLMSAMDDLATSVAAEDTVIDSAVALINGFSAQLTAAGTDPAKLTALKADVDAKKATLAAAVLAN